MKKIMLTCQKGTSPFESLPVTDNYQRTSLHWRFINQWGNQVIVSTEPYVDISSRFDTDPICPSQWTDGSESELDSDSDEVQEEIDYVILSLSLN